MRKARRVLGETGELRVRTGASEYPGVAFGEGATTLALKRTADDRGSASRGTGVDDLVHEVDKVIR